MGDLTLKFIGRKDPCCCSHNPFWSSSWERIRKCEGGGLTCWSEIDLVRAWQNWLTERAQSHRQLSRYCLNSLKLLDHRRDNPKALFGQSVSSWIVSSVPGICSRLLKRVRIFLMKTPWNAVSLRALKACSLGDWKRRNQLYVFSPASLRSQQR